MSDEVMIMDQGWPLHTLRDTLERLVTEAENREGDWPPRDDLTLYPTEEGNLAVYNGNAEEVARVDVQKLTVHWNHDPADPTPPRRTQPLDYDPHPV